MWLKTSEILEFKSRLINRQFGFKKRSMEKRMGDVWGRGYDCIFYRKRMLDHTLNIQENDGEALKIALLTR